MIHWTFIRIECRRSNRRGLFWRSLSKMPKLKSILIQKSFYFVFKTFHNCLFVCLCQDSQRSIIRLYRRVKSTGERNFHKFIRTEKRSKRNTRNLKNNFFSTFVFCLNKLVLNPKTKFCLLFFLI